MGPRLGRGGSALLSGLLRCRRCGQMLRIHYTQRSQQSRYHCTGAQVTTGSGRCISFGSGAVDEAVAGEILKLISGNAVEAAVEAIEQRRSQRQQQRQAVEMELEQARYESRLASRRYEGVDPDNRLVAAELEMRWNLALQKVALLEGKLSSAAQSDAEELLPDRELLLSLAQDLPAVWNSPAAAMRLKQRIVQILLREIVADVNPEATEIVLLLHWAGGRHSELRVAKRASRRGRSTSVEAVAVVRQMAGRFSDEQIAATMNRIALRTGDGNTWNQKRVAALRYRLQLPAHDATRETLLTMDQVADRLGISATAVRRLLTRKILPGTQALPWAPWEIRPEALDSDVVRKAVEAIRRRIPVPGPVADEPGPLFQQ